MTWMLSPAVILAWTSVELLVPGITMSETGEESQTHQEFIITSLIIPWEVDDSITYTQLYYINSLPTSSGDDPLHKHPGFLQAVDGKTSEAGCWWIVAWSRACRRLSGHHGNWSWLDWPDAGHWLLFSTWRWAPEQSFFFFFSLVHDFIH